MNVSRTTTARRSGAAPASAAQAILKGIARLLETLGPHPQLQPIPVRVRPRTGG